MPGDVAAAWIDRWDAQQTRYIADREERFAVIGDVVAHALGPAGDPVVLDVGCGPGSLSARLAHRLPGARWSASTSTRSCSRSAGPGTATRSGSPRPT
ncbi:hypothetical protein BJF78_13655 [Pseudonocardia sp. CNS-139]|nr:hypothetical protein BJF78_13655 [Pseudonocardia sp. CNS-139]